MKPLVILGRSPFVNTVNIPKLLQNHTVLGFNYCPYPVDILFTLFIPRKPAKLGCVVVHEMSIVPEEGVQSLHFDLTCSKKPLLKGPELAWQIFSISAALDWVIRQGYDELFLVGIDHVESDSRFIHHDGVDDHRGVGMLASAHQTLKEYVYVCAELVKIYQCNPAVAADWKLPFKPIEEVYDYLHS